MARGNCNFRQRDLTAAIKAVIKAGREPARAEIDPATGKIVVLIGTPENAEKPDGGNEWERI